MQLYLPLINSGFIWSIFLVTYNLVIKMNYCNMLNRNALIIKIIRITILLIKNVYVQLHNKKILKKYIILLD